MRLATQLSLPLGFFLLSCAPALCAAIPDNSMDIAIIDRAIASARPGAKTVMFGDCGMRLSDLRIFRSRLVAEESPAQGPQPLAVTPATSFTKWPGGIIPYRFDPTQVSSGTLTPAKMQQFRDGAGEWEAAANVQFMEFTGTTPTNFITVQEESTLGGGESTAVGMQGGEQFLQFGPTAWNRGTVCHEMGHALGYIHEQQRDDRDTYVIIDWNNIAAGNQPNFAKLPGGATEIGPYDFYSIMEYSRNALAIDPSQDTISMQPAYAQYANIIGAVYDRTLSTLDRAGMATLYGNPSVLPSALVTDTNDSGPGSLRSAIYYAFDRSTQSPPVTTTITFQIPKTDPHFNSSTGVFTITPTYELDAPGDGTTIDGTTQTTFTGNTNTKGPELVLNGSAFAQYETIGAGYQPGFILRQANCMVKGFVVQGFDTQGIQIMSTAATGNIVSGCYIGTDPTGATAVPNAYPGIEIYGGAHNNTIGGTTTTARNVISGNSNLGIYVHDTGTTGNLIEGNYIGLNALGTGAIGNATGGIQIALGAQTNTVGGTTTAARNVISGNLYQGVVITDAGTTGNVTVGNYIGLNAAGTAVVGNGFANTATHFYLPGVGLFNGSQNNIIGGTAGGSANVISGNAGGGVSISGVNGNGNIVEGNFIGTNPAGSAAMANGAPETNYAFGGVEIFGGAQSNTIGGTTAAARNIISGNGAQGVEISDLGTSSNIVEGNYIGTDVSGATAIANGFSGVGIFNSASTNTIGGTVTGAQNLISGNTYQGIAIAGPASGQTVGPTGNIVEGNFIGVNAAGSAALANNGAGVEIYDGSQSNIIGGTTAAARNVISGNLYQDVAISDPLTNANLVEGNYIGLDSTGAFAISNNNSGLGLFNGAQNNIIGGVSAGARNYISGHAQYGIFIENSGTNGNSVQGNTVGLNVSSAALGNSSVGIAIFDAAASNAIGGSVAGAGNIVANNAGGGIGLYNYTSNDTTIDDSLSENSIFGNSSFGIYLYSGANNNQAAPSLSSAIAGTSTNPGGTDVTGTLTSAASTVYRVEFFSSPSGNQGQTFLGFTDITTNSSGAASFTTSLTSGVTSGYALTATATDPSGNTSIFSTPVSVTSGTGGMKTQTITFPAIPNQAYSTTPITLNATASSGLPVSYSVASGPATVSGSALTLTGVGTVTVQASQAGNASYSAATPVNQSFTASKASQTITFPSIGNQVYGMAPITLSATASSGLPITYGVVSGPAMVSGNTLTITGVGTVKVKASQAGSADYNAATAVAQSFTVSKGSQTITFPAIGNQTYPGSPITLSATASSGLAVTYSIVSGPATVSGNTLTTTGAGTVTVQASQAGNADFNAASDVQQTFTVSGGAQSQTITFPAIPNQAYSTTPITLNATASSGLPVSYSVVSGPATVSGSSLTLTGVGTVTVQASQAGNASYSAATPVNQSFTVSKASQTITFSTIGNQVYPSSPITLTATASSGLPITYKTTGPISVSGNTLTTTGTGNATIVASQPGNADYNAATSIKQTFTVTKAGQQSQTITFPAIPNQAYSPTPIILNATASSGLPVSYSVVSGPATVSGSSLTLTGVGTVTVQASQAGNASYSAATPVNQSFTVSKASQTITFPTVGNPVYPSSPITLTATASSGLPITYKTTGPISVSGNTLTTTGTGNATITASQAGNADYNAAPSVRQTFTVTKASQL